MGKRPLIKGVVHTQVTRPGQAVYHYFYAWRGGPCIQRTRGGTKPQLTPEAIEAYHKAIAERSAGPANTIRSLVTAWRGSGDWKRMAASTRRNWEGVLAAITDRWGLVPLPVWEDRRMRAKIIAWRDTMASTPRTADYHVQVLRALLEWGKNTGRLERNAAVGIPTLYQGGNRAHIIWTEEEIAQWQTAPTPVRDAVNLARLTGVRRGDLVKLAFDHVQEFTLAWGTGKSRGRTVASVPLTDELRNLIEELRSRKRQTDTSTLLVNTHGKAWTANSIGVSFAAARQKLGFTKRLHDFRGTYATHLLKLEDQSGRRLLTDEQVAGIMGWNIAHIATLRRLYVDDEALTRAIGQSLITKQFAKHPPENRAK